MIHSIQQLIRRLKQARLEERLSQRELSQRVRLPQSQISKIENGGVDLRASSLIDLSRALGLEVMLVPRKLVPAVRSLTRQEGLTAGESVPAYRIDEDDDDG